MTPLDRYLAGALGAAYIVAILWNWRTLELPLLVILALGAAGAFYVATQD